MKGRKKLKKEKPKTGLGFAMDSDMYIILNSLGRLVPATDALTLAPLASAASTPDPHCHARPTQTPTSWTLDLMVGPAAIC